MDNLLWILLGYVTGLLSGIVLMAILAASGSRPAARSPQPLSRRVNPPSRPPRRDLSTGHPGGSNWPAGEGQRSPGESGISLSPGSDDDDDDWDMDED